MVRCAYHYHPHKVSKVINISAPYLLNRKLLILYAYQNQKFFFNLGENFEKGAGGVRDSVSFGADIKKKSLPRH